ncbi:hypothetical protein Patl1_36243 [Pistacia atlantica]|nr:hypothetical protein Patl1_36243 [Pistacia atlantica]
MMKVPVSNFRNAWESMGPDFERVDEYGLGPRESLTEANSAVISLLGIIHFHLIINFTFLSSVTLISMKLISCYFPFSLLVFSKTRRLYQTTQGHTRLLSDVFIGNVKVLVRLQFRVDGPKDIAMKLVVRSKDANVSDMIHEIVVSG